MSGESGRMEGRRTDNLQGVSHTGYGVGAPLAVDIALAGRFGIFNPCEAGMIYSFPITRTGLEVRCGLFQERWGDPLSVALGAAVGSQGIYDRGDSLWTRLQLDFSKHWPDTEFIANIGVTYGNEVHLFWYHETPDYRPDQQPLSSGSFQGGSDDTEPFNEAFVRRDEVRLGLSVGVGAELDDTVVFAWFSPHFVLWSDILDKIECRSCTGYTPLNYQHHITLSFGMGVHWLSSRREARDAQAQSQTGIGLLIAGYVLGFGVSGLYHTDGEDLASWALSLIPVAGPLAWAHTMDDGNRQFGSEYTVGYASMGLQVVGLSMLLYGLLHEEPYANTPSTDAEDDGDDTTLTIGPMPGGAMLLGTF